MGTGGARLDLTRAGHARFLQGESRLAQMAPLPVLLPKTPVRRRVRRQPPRQAMPRRRVDAATFDSTYEIGSRTGARNIVEWAGLISIAVIGALLFKTFCFQAFWIPSESMQPTLMVGDRIVVDKVTYHTRSVHRGDIVVFKRPPGETDTSIKDLIKRVIGLPGDTIEAKGGVLYRNGQLVSETYLPPGTVTVDLPPTVVPAGDVWLMGDNRTNSQDSRYFGPVSEKLIVGNADFRWWPIFKIGPL